MYHNLSAQLTRGIPWSFRQIVSKSLRPGTESELELSVELGLETRNRSGSELKAGVRLSFEGHYYEFLPQDKTINSDLYCQQLVKLKHEEKKKWPELINRKGVVFHHGNARSYTSLATQQILKKIGWEV
ncbi:Mariner Mos1 transposase [Eumeta japonica]|uniref:Mariner Mos1 transposase n=1 Tax=Eumeta variegata TaxID=151549 RepID=A0A4C1TCD3_EUMVA|nr:Mariner Mos1 transposase [Eumeta japonica]